MIPWERSCEIAAEVARAVGPRAVVWRYDPILLTSLTPVIHLKQFKLLADRLRGITDEVVVSFAQFYRKTMANLNEASKDDGMEWWDAPDEEKRDLITWLARVASSRAIQLTVCSQAAYAASEGARPSRCIDSSRLSDVAGTGIKAK